MAKIKGCEGYVEINGNRVDVTDWDFTAESDFQDVTDTGSGCFDEELATFTKGSGSGNLVVDASKMPTANPPNINAGIQVTNLFLFLGDSGKKIDCPLANIITVNLKSEVKGVVTFSFTFRTVKNFTMPV